MMTDGHPVPGPQASFLIVWSCIAIVQRSTLECQKNPAPFASRFSVGFSADVDGPAVCNKWHCQPSGTWLDSQLAQSQSQSQCQSQFHLKNNRPFHPFTSHLRSISSSVDSRPNLQCSGPGLIQPLNFYS